MKNIKNLENAIRSNNLSPMSKLIFAEIWLLANHEGYCFASNKYFADLYGVTKRSITRWTKEIKDNDLAIFTQCPVGYLDGRFVNTEIKILNFNKYLS